jgi:Tol biopolymer transport system component
MNRQQIQRILLIIAFIVFVVGIIVVTWFLFFQPFFRPAPPPGNANVAPGELPNANVNRPTNANINGPVATGPATLPTPSEVANGDLTLARRLSTKTAMKPTISPDGKGIVFYSDVDDRFVRLDPATGQLVDVVPQQFPDVKNITWSPNGQRAVLEFPDDRKVVYDFQKKQQYSLPNESQEFSFSKDSEKIAYEYVGSAPDESYLVTANANGTGSTAVAKLGEKSAQVQVAWSPSDEAVGLFRESVNATQQEIFLIGKNQENFKSITTEGSGFAGAWTPDGSKLLYTVFSEETNWNPELHLVYARGNQIGSGDTNLGLQTSLDKCAFNRAGTHAYCAVPDLMERGSGLYPEFSSNVKDTFYTINLTNGTITPLAQPVTDGFDRFTAGSPLLSADETSLYFVDQATQTILQIRLK